ncbi:uncharacterized protein LOC124556101 [Schistocerca americana]|uniref:uncharacterized protein LOC124556101 n=1 Tax=Schistocerca americana TaxID=7009 RepID=UPI001F4F685B|nr:uncharacterized protein LOC124556101 [Schistocerca americana]
MLPEDFQTEYLESQSEIQLKENLTMCLCWSFINHICPETSRAHPLLHSHMLHMSSLFGSKHICEQLFSGVKHTKSKNRTKISDECLENTLKAERLDTPGLKALLFGETVEPSLYQTACQVNTNY